MCNAIGNRNSKQQDNKIYNYTHEICILLTPLNPFVDANAKYRMESESRVTKINNKSIGRKILSKLEIKKFITTNIILAWNKHWINLIGW